VHQGEVDTKVAERSEQNGAPHSQRKVRYTKYPRNAYPKSFAEATERLQTARKNIIKNGYIAKYDDAELLDIVKSGELANERYHVRVIFGDVEDVRKNPLGFKRDSGRAPYWTTTFEQIEAADTDHHLIATLSGITNYLPDQKFTLAIIDSHNLPINAERQTFSPTYEKMTVLGKKELAPDFIKREILDGDVMNKIMTPEFSQEFKRHFDDYLSTGQQSWNGDRFSQFTKRSGLSKVNEDLLIARHRVLGEFGANELFEGNGLTRVDKNSKWGSKVEQDFGVAEIITFERDPLTINQLNEVNDVVTLLPTTAI